MTSYIVDLKVLLQILSSIIGWKLHSACLIAKQQKSVCGFELPNEEWAGYYYTHGQINYSYNHESIFKCSLFNNKLHISKARFNYFFVYQCIFIHLDFNFSCCFSMFPDRSYIETSHYFIPDKAFISPSCDPSKAWALACSTTQCTSLTISADDDLQWSLLQW